MRGRATLSENGQERAWIEAEEGGFRIGYTIQGNPVWAWVAYEHTFPNYGGRRTWFTCPVCGRRCGVLYLAQRVACRKCLGLYYPCQGENCTGRGIALMLRWKDKINYWSGRRPRYMHRKKYLELLQRIQRRENASLMQFMGQARIRKLLGR